MLTNRCLEDFTLDSYRELLQHFATTHGFFTFREFANGSPRGKAILLRHDIDYSLTSALQMAQLEAELGIRATYFLLFSSPFYNLHSEVNAAIPRRIAQLGHEIGLHYDVVAMLKGSPTDPATLLRSEAAVLEHLSDSKVTTIAMHNPSITGADIFRDEQFLNAYEPRFTTQIAYFSDSCMAWRDSFAQAATESSVPDRFQLLIHPCVWTGQPLERQEKLEQILNESRQVLEECGVAMHQIWRNHSGVKEHEARRNKPAERVLYAAGGAGES